MRRARSPDAVERAYTELIDAVRFFARLPILTYNQAAIARFAQLRGMNLNVAGMDLRIGAIALESGAVIVTRNVRDFGRIPGLRVEDGSAPLAGP